jgi:putative DNA primase/helicase
MSEARALTVALGGRWRGRYGTARCPAHDDYSPSLSISERGGKVLVRCHAAARAPQ